MPHVATSELIWKLRTLERVTLPAERQAVTGLCLALAHAAQSSRDDDPAVGALFAGFRAGVTPTTPYAASEADRLKRAVMWCRLEALDAADVHGDLALCAATSWLWAAESALGFSLASLAATTTVTSEYARLLATRGSFDVLGKAAPPAVIGDIAALADALAAHFPGGQGASGAAQTYVTGSAVFGNERAEGRVRLARALWLLDHRADGYLRIDDSEAVHIRALAREITTDWRESAAILVSDTKCCPTSKT